MKLELLNTSILTSEGTYKMEPISLAAAQVLYHSALVVEAYGHAYAESNGIASHSVGVESAIGHQATADILSQLLNANTVEAEQVPVLMNRIAFAQAEGQQALVFKIRGRVPEGTVLTREQIDELGFDFFLLKRLSGTFLDTIPDPWGSPADRLIVEKKVMNVPIPLGFFGEW